MSANQISSIQYLSRKIDRALKHSDLDWLNEQEVQIKEFILSYPKTDLSILELLLKIRRIRLITDAPFLLCEIADAIIEEQLDANLFKITALQLFQDELKWDVFTPLWILLAQSDFADKKDFRLEISFLFEKNPIFFAKVIEKTKNIFFLEILENHLNSISPTIGYLIKPDPKHKNHEIWDMWLSVGYAYLSLLNDPDRFSKSYIKAELEEKFLKTLPLDENSWLASAQKNLKFRFFLAKMALKLEDLNN